MNKLFAFAVFCLYILGSIGGFGFAVYGGSWPCAAGVVVLAIMAFPEFKKYWKELSD